MHSDIIVGTAAVKPSQYVKQLLGSVKSMYEMRMPPEFVSDFHVYMFVKYLILYVYILSHIYM